MRNRWRAWWDDLDIDEIRSFITDAYVTPFRIVAANATVGYAQAYHANRDPFWVAFGVPRETFGLDLSIGETATRGRGVGRVAFRLLVDRLFAWREVVRVQIDPIPTTSARSDHIKPSDSSSAASIRDMTAARCCT